MFTKRRTLQSLYFIFFVAILFFVINRFVFPLHAFVDRAVSVAAYPVLIVQNYVSSPVRSVVARVQRVQHLDALLEESECRYKDLLENYIALQASHDYNDATKEVVAFKERYTYHDAILSQIVVRNGSEHGQTCLVDAGEKKGVEKDMVAVYKHCLLGKVVEVYPYYSRVQLITDKDCSVAAYCSKTKSHGIHVGCNKQGLTSLQRVSHLCSVEQGDLVVSSGKGLVFPRGFALGNVSHVSVDGVCCSIDVTPFLDIQSLEYCLLIKKDAG